MAFNRARIMYAAVFRIWFSVDGCGGQKSNFAVQRDFTRHLILQ